MLKQLYVVIIIFTLVACGDKDVELLSSLSEVDANEVVAALVSGGIKAKKIKTKKSIAVFIKENDISVAVDLLKAKGLPNKSHSNFGEIFKKEGMISTPLEEKARYIYGISQELESSLSQVDGVLIARVHVVLSERIAPGQPVRPSSAAVMIKHLPELDPDSIEPRIKRLIISSIPGLSTQKEDKISISFFESKIEEPDVIIVNYLGLMMTEKSANELHSALVLFMVIALALILIIASGAFYILHRKKTNDSPQTNTDDDIEEIEPEYA